LWQVYFYIALRGWPFSAVASRATRLLIANITVLAAGVLTYAILDGGVGLGPSTTTAVAGSLLAAVLLHGMLFEGLPRSPEHPARERALTSGIVVLLGAGLYGALTALAHQAHWTTAAPEQWGRLRVPQRNRPRRDPARRHRPTLAIRHRLADAPVVPMARCSPVAAVVSAVSARGVDYTLTDAARSWVIVCVEPASSATGHT
jgi:hypothetical protein